MGRQLQKKKSRSSVSKVTRRKNPRAFKPKNFGNAIIAENWDKKQTLSQNYARLGLASRLNASTWCTPIGSSTIASAAVPANVATLHPGEARLVRDPETGEVTAVQHGPTVEDALDAPTFAPAPATTDVVRQLEAVAASGVKRERTQSEGEREWIKNLVAKHGSDYKAMSRDRKLNMWQQSEGDIKRRVSRWQKKYGSTAEVREVE